MNLQVLAVGGNMLVGSIPSSIFNLSSITAVNVVLNQIQEGLPSDLGRSLPNLQSLAVGANLLTGSIPVSLSNASKLEKLDMGDNKVTGKVPSLKKLHRLWWLSFQGNQLGTGGKENEDLSFLSSLTNATCLNYFAPSDNNFGGTLTEELIGNFSTSLTQLLMAGNQIYGSIPTAMGNLVNLQIIDLSFNQLTANLIGAGSFGSVYKGSLDHGEKVVAVKVLNLQFRGASKSFIAECKALKNIKHWNLLKVLTACSSVDYNGNDFKALIYEFMVNGSLEEWLHPNENEDEVQEKSRNLDILQRLNIAIDVALALDYLHHYCPKPIVHCDLKPSNVLLDNDMTAHVGDFGLARCLPGTTYDSSANQSSSIGIRGSVGYAASEYGMGNEVSTCGDVYSYGILLLEMFTVKRPTNSMFNHTLSIHNFAKVVLPKLVLSIVDPSLLHRSVKEEASSSTNNAQNHSSTTASSHKIQECLISILNVGTACLEELPRDRMAIKDVVTQLLVIKKTLIGSGGVHGGRRDRIAMQS